MRETDPQEVILLVHGIRTTAPWAEMVASILEGGMPDVSVVPIRYGFFDLFRFLLPGPTRRPPISRLAREARRVRARHPEARLSVVAHSFGTYAVSRVLSEESDIKLHRLVLCGSIVPQDFRWDLVEARVEEDVLNDCGVSDLWPLLAASGSWGYGPSGTLGFGTVGVRDRFHHFGHSGFFSEEFVRSYWLPYFQSGTVVPTEFERIRPTPGSWMPVLGKLPIKWISLAAVAAMLGVGLGLATKPPLRYQLAEELGEIERRSVEACVDRKPGCEDYQSYMVRIRTIASLVWELSGIMSRGYTDPGITDAALPAYRVEQARIVMGRLLELHQGNVLQESVLSRELEELRREFEQTFYRKGRCADGTPPGSLLCASADPSRRSDQFDSMFDFTRELGDEIAAGST